MKKLCWIVIVIALSSCSVNFYTPKGNYPKPPVMYHSDKSIDKVWDNLIDIFAEKGLSIKIIDKSSGLIVSERKSLPFSVEDKNGKIADPSAFVVLPRIVSQGFEKPLMPVRVFGEWNVRVKSNGAGSTININLLNFSADYGDPKGESALFYQKAKKKYEGSLDGQTTGVFENYIAEAIK